MKKVKKERCVTKSMVAFNKVLFLITTDLKKCTNKSRKQIIKQLDHDLTILKLMNMRNIRKAIDAGKYDDDFPF